MENSPEFKLELEKYKVASVRGLRDSYIQKNFPLLWQFFIEKPGNTFSERVYRWVNIDNLVEGCKVCGEKTKFLSFGRGYQEFCSKKCSNSDPELVEKKQQKFLEKWGVRNPMEVAQFRDKLSQTKKALNYESINSKYKENFLKIWGVENPSQLDWVKEKKELTSVSNWGVQNPFESEQIKQKIVQTNLENLGVEYPLQSDKIRLKARRKLLSSFGVDNPMKSQTVRNKFRQTCLNRWGSEHFRQSDEFKRLSKEAWLDELNQSLNQVRVIGVSDLNFSVECLDCGLVSEVAKNTLYVRKRFGDQICPNCNPVNENTSIAEKRWANWIREVYSGQIICNYRVGNMEIDIFLPEKNFGLEFNGLYWHSTKFKDRYFHTNKINFFKKQGITIFNIWEDYGQEEEIIKSMILNRIGLTKRRIGARKCEVKVIEDTKLVRQFLDTNHIQGFVGSKVKVGLFYQDELVSLMTFGELRKSLGSNSQEGDWELIRFCNKLGLIVVGGASKLFEFFRSNYSHQRVISYSKNDYSDGGLYEKLGFKFVGDTPPNYWWVVGGVRVGRFNFRKNKLVESGADPTLTETEIMEGRGFHRVFDSGNKKWIFLRPV